LVRFGGNKRICGLSVKRHQSLLGVLNVKLVYMPSCIRPEVKLTPDQRILCSDCYAKMYYG